MHRKTVNTTITRFEGTGENCAIQTRFTFPQWSTLVRKKTSVIKKELGRKQPFQRSFHCSNSSASSCAEDLCAQHAHDAHPHLTLTCALPTSWGGSADESQDSGGSGNFLSAGVGQGLASPNRSAPPAASARASTGRRAPYKEGRAYGPHALGTGLRDPVPGFRRRRPGQHVRPAPGTEEGTGAARRGLPVGPAPSPTRRPFEKWMGSPCSAAAAAAARLKPGGHGENRYGRRRRRRLPGPCAGSRLPPFPSH